MDTEFWETEIIEVVKSGKGWSFTGKDGWSFYSPVRPRLGQLARLYGRGHGYTVRGLDLGGKKVFYRTSEQQKKRVQKETEKFEAEMKQKESEPKNPDPQISGFEWTDDMAEVSGFHGGYEQTCRRMVSQGAKWILENPTANPRVQAFENVFGLAMPENKDAKALDSAIMAGIEDSTGAMHHAAMNHIFAIKNMGSWEKYQKHMKGKEHVQ